MILAGDVFAGEHDADRLLQLRGVGRDERQRYQRLDARTTNGQRGEQTGQPPPDVSNGATTRAIG